MLRVTMEAVNNRLVAKGGLTSPPQKKGLKRLCCAVYEDLFQWQPNDSKHLKPNCIPFSSMIDSPESKSGKHAI